MGRRKGARKADPENAEAPTVEASPPKFPVPAKAGPKLALSDDQKAAKKREMMEILEREANSRANRMESLITMLGQSLVIRCEAILDRLPADVRAMPVRDFLRIHGGKITGILRPAGEIEGRRSTIASRRGTVTVRGDEEDEEERMRKRKRELGIVGDESRQKKQRRVSEDEDDLTADSDRSRSSAAFHRKLPQTPSVANRPVRRAKRNERMYSINGSPLRAEDEEAEPRSKRSSMRLAAMEDEQDETDPLVNDRPPKQSFVPPGGPEYSFDPTKILSAAMTGSFAVPKDPAQKRELEKHMKKMQEEFEKIQKMMAGGVKSGAAAKKGPVQLKAAKAKAGR